MILWRDLSPGVLIAGAAIGAAMALILGSVMKGRCSASALSAFSRSIWFLSHVPTFAPQFKCFA